MLKSAESQYSYDVSCSERTSRPANFSTHVYPSDWSAAECTVDTLPIGDSDVGGLSRLSSLRLRRSWYSSVPPCGKRRL